MKKLINLQMFAESTATAAETANTATETAAEGKDTKAAETAAEKKYSDADVNALIDRKFAEWQKKQDKAVEDAKAKEKEAAKLAQMNENQKKDYQIEQMQKELAEFKRKDTLAEMSKTARKMLSDENITVPDELLSMLVTTDATETKTAVDSFMKLYKEAVEDEVKNRLRGNTPKTGTGGAATLSEIDKRLKKYV